MALKRIGGPVTELSGPVDYNTMTTTGVYHQGSYNDARASTNGAHPDPGLLEVFSASGLTYQRYTAYRGGGTYIRSYYGYIDTWEPWQKVATENQAPEVATASGAGWNARKVDGVVELRINGLDASATETLPAGFTPAEQTYVSVSAKSTMSSYTPRVAVTINGVLTSQGYTGAAYGITTYSAT